MELLKYSLCLKTRCSLRAHNFRFQREVHVDGFARSEAPYLILHLIPDINVYDIYSKLGAFGEPPMRASNIHHTILICSCLDFNMSVVEFEGRESANHGGADHAGKATVASNLPQPSRSDTNEAKRCQKCEESFCRGHT